MAPTPGRMTIGAPASVLPEVDAVEDAIWADRDANIAAVWFIDHLLGWVPRGADPKVIKDPHAMMDPFSLMAAAARATSRVQIGVAVTDPLRRSPAALAQAALTIGWLGGRPIALGIGSGARENLAPFGLERPHKLRYLREACAEISAYLGRKSESTRAPLGVAAAADAKLYVAAHGPHTIDLAARYADGWLPAGLPPQAFGSRLALLRERAEAYGRDPAEIRPTLFLWAALAETREESLAVVERPFVRAVSLYSAEAAYRRHGAVHPLGGADYMPGDMSPAEALATIGRVPLEVARDVILCGSIDDVRERLNAYEQAGCEHVIVYDIGRYLGADGVPRSRACLSAVARP